VSELDELAAQIAVGDEAKKFKDSDIGRYLSAVAKQDEDNAKDALLALNVWSFTSLIELQNAISALKERVMSFRMIEQYLHEAISEGEAADHQLNNEED
jgi:hypothetical protein